ncbi:MAG TPA: hypothetical protein VFW07_04305 [Parafilimonas sp.]|nr:hypothetical protein [Parafilimonas sp.]
MPLKHKIYFALAAIHLVMIALYSTHFADWGNMDNPASKTLATVGRYTGSNNIFSFFAPGLSDQPYVVYNVKFKDSSERYIDLTGKSPDFTNRINNIYGYLTIPEARAVLSASLAQNIKERYPGAAKIRVAMVVQQIPDMTAYRAGKRSHWKFWFQRDFSVDSTANSQQ